MNKDSNEQNEDLSFSDKIKMYGQLGLASRTLLDNYLLLFIKKNDNQLSQEAKNLRDQADKVIFGVSLIGKVAALAIFTRRLSFLNGMAFNPIRDIQTLLMSYGCMAISDSVPITYYWPQFEPHIMRFQNDTVEYLDIYANNLMNPFKLYYYVNFL